MPENELRDEKLNIRRFYLRLLQRLWVLPACALCGAVLCFLLYKAAASVTQPALYEARAEIYLHFVENATDDRVYDHYNAYTWNDVVHTDAMRACMEKDETAENAMRAYLETAPEQTATDAEEDAARWYERYLTGEAIVTATLPSDTRLLHLTATDAEAESASYLSKRMAYAVLSYAKENEALRDAEIMDFTAPARATYPKRGGVAAISGAVLGLIVAIFGLMIARLLDDSIDTPEEVEERFGLSAIGILPDENETKERVPALFQKELAQNIDALIARLGDEKEIAILCDLDEAEQNALSKTLSMYASQLQSAQIATRMISAKEAEAVLTNVTAQSAPSGVKALLAVPCGKKDGALLKHLQSQAAARGQDVVGALLIDADMTFLKRYYRLKA